MRQRGLEQGDIPGECIDRCVPIPHSGHEPGRKCIAFPGECARMIGELVIRAKSNAKQCGRVPDGVPMFIRL
jgi:hypothetical protein